MKCAYENRKNHSSRRRWRFWRVHSSVLKTLSESVFQTRSISSSLSCSWWKLKRDGKINDNYLAGGKFSRTALIPRGIVSKFFLTFGFRGKLRLLLKVTATITIRAKKSIHMSNWSPISVDTLKSGHSFVKQSKIATDKASWWVYMWSVLRASGFKTMVRL